MQSLVGLAFCLALLACGRIGFGLHEDFAADGGEARQCTETAPILVAATSSSGPSIVETTEGFALAWSELSKVQVQRFSRAGIPQGLPIEVAPSDDALIGAEPNGLAVVLPQPPALFRISPAGVVGVPEPLSAIVAPNVRGLVHSGVVWQVGGADSSGRLVLESGSSAALIVSTIGTWVTTAAMGSTTGYSWREDKTCFFTSFNANGIQGPAARAKVASNCYDPSLAASPGGFVVTYHTAGTLRPRMVSIDEIGTQIAADVDIGPSDQLKYRSVYNTTSSKVIYALYSPSNLIGQKLLSRLTADGTALAPPEALSAYGNSHDLASLPGGVVLSCRGGTTALAAGESAIYVQLRCGP
jgi:hypothetical protein